MRLETCDELIALLQAKDLPKWSVAWPPSPNHLATRLRMSQEACERYPSWLERKIRETPEAVTEYDLYLTSGHWTRMRRVAYLLSNFRCAKCKIASEYIHVHHLNYDRLGSELLSDLEPLCAKCHAAVHGK